MAVPAEQNSPEAEDLLAVLDQINALLDSEHRGERVSIHVPKALRDAARLAVTHLGAAPTVARFAAQALYRQLEAVVTDTAFESHYQEYPWARPSLAELALAEAQLKDHPLAQLPSVIERAAAEIIERRPDADAHDVLVWAEARGYA